MVPLYITDLSVSVTVERLVVAVAEASNCPFGVIMASDIKPGSWGMDSTGGQNYCQRWKTEHKIKNDHSKSLWKRSLKDVLSA